MLKLVLRAVVVTAVTIGGWMGLVAAQGGQLFGRVPAGPGCAITYVYDGDTVALDCGTGREITARLQGFDTPESKSRARCSAEAALADRATQRLRALVASGETRLDRVGVDKYRRPLMQLWVNNVDVADTLVREGLAVRYAGGARPDWCTRLGQKMAPGVGPAGKESRYV